MKRRDALRVLGLSAGAVALARPRPVQAATPETDDPVAVLVDTTRCIGCRMCEFACAEANGLRVVHSNIQDFSGNSTRFFVIGRTPNEETGRDKSAMIFAVLDRVGALHDVLGILRHHAINLCNIQTRPAKGRVALESGDYLFFAEFWGHHLQPEVAAAVEEIRSLCTLVKMLGSWPARATSD